MIGRLRWSLAALLVLCLGSATAGAATISHVAGAPLAWTDWTVSLVFPKFDPATGTLTSVSFEVRDSLVAVFHFENASTSSACTNRDSSKATIQLQRPDATLITSTIAAREDGRTMAVYDGVLDFGGTSGYTSSDLVAYESATRVVTDASDLALFTGTDTISLPCKAVGRSYVSNDCGNGTHWVSTRAAAYVVVTYTFDSVVPVTNTTWGRIKALYR